MRRWRGQALGFRCVRPPSAPPNAASKVSESYPPPIPLILPPWQRLHPGRCRPIQRKCCAGYNSPHRLHSDQRQLGSGAFDGSGCDGVAMTKEAGIPEDSSTQVDEIVGGQLSQTGPLPAPAPAIYANHRLLLWPLVLPSPCWPMPPATCQVGSGAGLETSSFVLLSTGHVSRDATASPPRFLPQISSPLSVPFPPPQVL